jgi:hypothetical protein
LALVPQLQQVRNESDCVDGGVCAGGVHNPGAGEYRGAEFRSAVRLSGQSAACGGATLGFVLLLVLMGLGLHEVLKLWPFLTRVVQLAGVAFLLFMA